MKFNICYMGPEHLFHLRRDFVLVLKYALDDLGHDVVLSGVALDQHRFNLIIGAYFLPPESIKKIASSGVKFAHINSEIIGNDMLNFNPKKVDFLGDYLPSMRGGSFVWDVVMGNLEEHSKYGVNAHFLRWAWHPKMQDIEHRTKKDIDIYFFGMLSERRKKLLNGLGTAGITGLADNTCPYFVRNDRISRAKIHLNLRQDDKYSHVNSFRICYLANNSCCILSDKEVDPANYQQYAEVVDSEHLVEHVKHFLSGDNWRIRGEKALADFQKITMRNSMAELMEKSFAGGL